MDDGGIKKSALLNSSVLASLCYCYFISSRIPRGSLRLISLLPIFFLFTIFPLFIQSVLFTGISSFFLTWLANFKLVLFAFGKGPLCSARSSKSLPVFIASAALPVRMKPDSSSSRLISKKKKLFILNNLGLEILATSILIAFLSKHKQNFNPKILLAMYCCLIFLLLDCVVASSSFVVRALVSLELEPPSDEPYLSTSLQDFWGRRWNLAVTNSLRQTVYKPVRSVSVALFGDRLARILGFLAAFLVSALMHELILYYITRAKPSWEMTSFFVFHGFCVILELGIKKGLNGRWDLPRFVSCPMTLGFVVLTSFWLFFPPFIRNDADAAVLEEFMAFGEFVQKGIFSYVS